MTFGNFDEVRKFNSVERSMLPTNKRRAERHKGNFGATIILPNGERHRCIVKDFSKTGAMLLVKSVLGLPAQFALLADGGPKRAVEVVRRGSGKLAVRFV